MLAFGMTQYFIVYQWQVQYADRRSQIRVRGQITVQRQIDNSKHPKCLLAKINYTLQNRVLALTGN